MKKSKSIQTLDRLSELPDSLIHAIFGLLPMRDVVATTILSKRWTNLWITTPCLNFDDRLSADAKFITPTLMFWKGTKILKLNIEKCYQLKHRLFSNVDLWVRFAKDNEVQEFNLHLVDLDSNNDQYSVPQSLFSSCPSLQVLSLRGCKLHIVSNVQWNHLKSLTIRCEVGLRCDDISRVLDGSPQLEVLLLRFYETNEHLTIRSTSLKKLLIDKFVRSHDEVPKMSTRLTICTPNLETFEMSNVPYFYCSLDDVSSLTDVSLLFHDCDCYDMLGSVASLFKEALKKIFPAIQHVENVTLSHFCIKALRALINTCLVPKLWGAKLLKLNSYFFNHREIVDVFKNFPKVKMLVLEDLSKANFDDVESYLNFPQSFPHLKTVEVTWGECNYLIFSLIEILLKYAGNLEKMVFRVNGIPSKSTKSLLLASQKLLRMQRASSIAKLIFCEY